MRGTLATFITQIHISELPLEAHGRLCAARPCPSPGAGRRTGPAAQPLTMFPPTLPLRWSMTRGSSCTFTLSCREAILRCPHVFVAWWLGWGRRRRRRRRQVDGAGCAARWVVGGTCGTLTPTTCKRTILISDLFVAICGRQAGLAPPRPRPNRQQQGGGAAALSRCGLRQRPDVAAAAPCSCVLTLSPPLHHCRSNPHYKPEVAAQTTLINFSVTVRLPT